MTRIPPTPLPAAPAASRAAAPPAITLPVEIVSRELDAKLLLACLAAARGHAVILGCQDRIHAAAHRLPRSVYLFKSVSRRTLRMQRHLRRLGHAVVAWDEEALVYMAPEFYVRRKTWPATLAGMRAFFAWGEDNAAVWRGAPGYRGQPIAVTGNPRADLLRPELRGRYREAVAALRQRFGRFVLVNSNFGGVNHYLPEVSRPRLEGLDGRLPAAPDGIGTWDDPGMVAHRLALFTAFREMLPALAAALPETAIVLRPHPSENPAVWQDTARGLANVRVEQEGSVVPWLLAAAAVVHNGCTTGVEAFLLDRPTIAYRPVTHPTYDISLPNALSAEARDADGLATLIRRALAGGLAQTEAQRALAARFVAARDGRLAAERILDAIAGWEAAGDLFPRRTPAGWIAGQVGSRARVAKRRLKVVAGGLDPTPYIRHRFPETSAAAIQERVDALRGTLGMATPLRVAAREYQIFRIEPDPPGP